MAATFSYAQAAKGMPTQPSVKPTSAEPNNAVSSPEEQNPDATSQATQEPQAPASGTETPRETEQTAAPSTKEPEPAAAAIPKQDVSGTSSPSVGNSSTAPKDEESSNTVNGTSESTWDKQSQASGSEKPNGIAPEETKEKTAGKEKKEKKNAPPKELKAAPLPSINIWQQRKEAQDARVKVTGNLKPAAPAAKTGASKTASTASSTSGENQQDQPKASSKKKGADGVPEGAAKHRNKADGKGRDEGKPEIGSRTCGSCRKSNICWERPLGKRSNKTRLLSCLTHAS